MNLRLVPGLAFLLVLALVTAGLHPAGIPVNRHSCIHTRDGYYRGDLLIACPAPGLGHPGTDRDPALGTGASMSRPRATARQ